MANGPTSCLDRPDILWFLTEPQLFDKQPHPVMAEPWCFLCCWVHRPNTIPYCPGFHLLRPLSFHSTDDIYCYPEHKSSDANMAGLISAPGFSFHWWVIIKCCTQTSPSLPEWFSSQYGCWTDVTRPFALGNFSLCTFRWVFREPGP